MATALDVLKRSMRLIGALGAGEEPTADEGADGLAALNSMLDAWWSKTLAVFYTQSEAFTWGSGNASRTMGSGGNFSTTRPSRIVSAFQRDTGNIDIPIEIIDDSEYWRIPDKTTQSTIIGKLYPQYGTSLVTLYAYPVPSASVSVHIQSLARLQSFASLSADVALPPGYQRALEYNLALEIAPEYQAQVPPLVATNALGSLRGIKRTNLELAPLLVEPGLMYSGRGSFNINTGD